MSGDGAARATAQQAHHQGSSFSRVLKRTFELFWMLLATIAALFFFQTAKEKAQENEVLKAELRRSKQKTTEGGGDRCAVCLENPREVVIQPCGHVCLCRDCVNQTLHAGGGHCPICRYKIANTSQVFLS